MIKNIIKRVIVGVLIALVFSFISSCNVKAVSKAISINTLTLYSQGVDTNATTETGSLNNQYYYNVYTNNNYSPTAGFYDLYLYNIHTNDYYNFNLNDYFSFIVYGNGIEASAVSGTIRASSSTEYFECHTITTGLIPNTDTSGVNDSFSVIECPMTGVDRGGSGVDLHIYFNYSTSVIRPINIRINRQFYFYDDSLKPLLNDVVTALGTSNVKLEAILTALTSNNTALSTINQSIQSQTTQQHQDSQQTQQKLDDINNTMKDDNVDEPNDYSSNVASNGVITQLITLPITLFQKLLNSTSASCTPFQLGDLLGTTLTIPCINLQNYLGSTLFNVIDILISGLFIYSISRKMVKVFNSLSSMKEGDVVNG